MSIHCQPDAPRTDADVAPSSPPGEPRRKARRRRNQAAACQLKTLSDLDGRTVAARRCRDLVNAITADLGGPDLPIARAALVTRCALLVTYLEDIEARWLAGEQIDATAYLAGVNTFKRVAESIGLDRVAKAADVVRQHYDRLAQFQAAHDASQAAGVAP